MILNHNGRFKLRRSHNPSERKLKQWASGNCALKAGYSETYGKGIKKNPTRMAMKKTDFGIVHITYSVETEHGDTLFRFHGETKQKETCQFFSIRCLAKRRIMSTFIRILTRRVRLQRWELKYRSSEPGGVTSQVLTNHIWRRDLPAAWVNKTDCSVCKNKNKKCRLLESECNYCYKTPHTGRSHGFLSRKIIAVDAERNPREDEERE